MDDDGGRWTLGSGTRWNDAVGRGEGGDTGQTVNEWVIKCGVRCETAESRDLPCSPAKV